MDNSLMSVMDSGRRICAESESSCLLQELGSCIKHGVDVCTIKFTVIIFPLLALLIGAICMPLAKRFRVTYHLLVLGAGVALGLLGCGVDLGLLSVSLRQWVHVNPPAILLYVFLAPLVFAASFNTSWHVFRRLLFPILVSALILLSLQVGLIGAFQMIVIRSEGWSWWSALMFGSMVSATDPIGVTTALNLLGASPLLSTFVDGESLVSYGSAIVLWFGFFVNAQIDFTAAGADAPTSSVGEIIGDVFKLILGGVAIGIAFALVVLIILSCVYDEFEVETSLTVVVAFLGFWTAQALSELSGVTANVASGLLLSAFGRQLITPSVRKPLGEFWKLLGWIGSTIIFVHAGLLLSAFAWSCAGEPHLGRDYAFIIVWYVFLQVIRIVLFLLFRPVLSFRNKWLGWKEAFFLGFSGLRGALSLLLALEVAGSPALPEEVKSRVILWTTGVVALSLLINGFLLKPVIHGLKFDGVQKPKEEFIHRARSAIVHRTLQILDHLCIEPGYKSVRWSYVIQNVLPPSWLLEVEHAAGSTGSSAGLLNHARSPGATCLERESTDKEQRIAQETPGHHSNQDDLSSRLPVRLSPRPSLDIVDVNFHRNIQKSMSTSPYTLNPVLVPAMRGVSQQRRTTHTEASDPDPNVIPISSTFAHSHPRNVQSFENDPGRTRRSDAGAMRNFASESIQQQGEKTPKDREVNRRMLTAMLSHVRAITNASLVEYSVLLQLEEDIQYALDANAEGKEYELFSFLNSARTREASIWRRGYLSLIEGKKLRGESLVTKTVVVLGTLTSILNGRILLDAPIVLKQAKQLYKRATSLLNRLEALNPYVFGWVTSQFAIYLVEHSQDSALSDLLASGMIDEHEFNVIQAELVQIRRKHGNPQKSLLFRAATLPDPKPLSLLREHQLFVGLNSRTLSQILDEHGALVDLQCGQELQVEHGSLVLVLQGAIQPTEDYFHPVHSDGHKNSITAIVSSSNPKTPGDEHEQSLRRFGESLRAEWGSSNGEVFDESDRHEAVSVETRSCSGSLVHWCFSPGNAFCGHSAILDSYNVSGVGYAIDRNRLLHTRFKCCDHTKSTTVFTLPPKHVKALACVSEEFRLEMTRSLARELVLSSIMDRSPYTLTNFFQFAPTDINTVVGRAFQILGRLPYMKLVVLRAGPLLRLQGPAVLVNGTVQVSVSGTGGSGESLTLLHKELTGPALLPSSCLVLQEVPSKHGLENQTSVDGETGPHISEGSGTSLTSSIELHSEREKIAHILVDTLQTDENDLERVRRWTMSDIFIDMNGRFGMHSHADLAPLLETKVE